MTSSAISAQGSTLQVATGTGATVAVTAIALGYPTILTAAANGFSNGDSITFDSGFTGADAALLNGKTATIRDVTTNTFAVEIDTTGKTITVGTGHATGSTYSTVKNLKSFSGFDGQASEIDVSNLSSTAKEFRLGLVDYGMLQLEFDHDNADAGQAALLAAYNAAAAKSFKLTLPNANVASFTAYVRKFSAQGGVDQVVKRQCDLRISGPVTWA